jgi:hypothetical protein
VDSAKKSDSAENKKYSPFLDATITGDPVTSKVWGKILSQPTKVFFAVVVVESGYDVKTCTGC